MQLIRVIKKFSELLSQHQKKRVGQLAVLMVLGGIAETMSVALMLPFMNTIMYPDDVMKNKYVIMFCNVLGIQSSRTFLVFLALILAMAYLFKNAFLVFEYNIQSRFVHGNMFSLQARMHSNFIHRPYEYFLQANSGEIIKVIYTDVSGAFSILTTLLQLFTEIVVSGMLIATVFVIEPGITLLVAVILLGLVAGISCFIRPILKTAGKKTQGASAGMYKWLLQSIQGIKEVKVMGKEKFFEKNFNICGTAYIQSLRKNHIVSLIPRFLIEAVCMSIMFLLLAVLIYRGRPLESIIPTLSVVALAAMRLLPSVNRISSQFAAISYGEPMLDKLIENLNDLSSSKNASLIIEAYKEEEGANKIQGFQRSIELSSITYSYPGTEKKILEDAGLTIRKGQSVGIVGASGAGKTTVIDVMLGLLDPQCGEILLDGINVQEDIHGFLKQVGYIPQMIFMLDDSIRANVAFGEEKVSDEDVWRSLKEASLFDFVKELPDGLDTLIGERGVRLSGGQRQRIGIARALYHNPEILVFDEATSALDNETEKSIMESVNHLKGQKTMIIIAHRLTTIENCDVVYQVADGKIVDTKLNT